MLCRVLHKTPTQIGEMMESGDLTPRDIRFLYAGIEWEIDITGKRGAAMFLI